MQAYRSPVLVVGWWCGGGGEHGKDISIFNNIDLFLPCAASGEVVGVPREKM
jgi:hypothetical protein